MKEGAATLQMETGKRTLTARVRGAVVIMAKVAIIVGIVSAMAFASSRLHKETLLPVCAGWNRAACGMPLPSVK